MKKYVIEKILLNPTHPADEILIRRLRAIGGNKKGAHLKLAAFHYFGVLDELVKANNPHVKDYLSVDISRQSDDNTALPGMGPDSQKKEDPLDRSTIFAEAFGDI